jgi:hypothetical protein
MKMNINANNSNAAKTTVSFKGILGSVLGVLVLVAMLATTASAAPAKSLPGAAANAVRELAPFGPALKDASQPAAPSVRPIKPSVRHRHHAESHRSAVRAGKKGRSLVARTSSNEFQQWLYGGSSGSWNFWWAEYYEGFGPTWTIYGYWNNPSTGQLLFSGRYCEYFPDFAELGWTCH